MRAPQIADSTIEERRAFIRERYQCISNCDLCGICATFHSKDPERIFADYIDGKVEHNAVAMRYRG